MSRQYWIIIDEQPAGPYTRDQLAALDTLRPDSRVWYESLTDWMEAVQIADLAPLFDTAAATPDGMPLIPGDTDIPDIPAIPGDAECAAACADTLHEHDGDGTHRPYVVDAADIAVMMPRPANYLAWSIVCILVFNTILGIVALVCSLRVNRRYRRGEYERAVRASESAQWWIIGSIVLGLVFMPLRLTIFGF